MKNLWELNEAWLSIESFPFVLRLINKNVGYFLLGLNRLGWYKFFSIGAKVKQPNVGYFLLV